MASKGLSTRDAIDELRRETAKLATMIEEIASHYEKAELDSAVSVASLGHYNTSHIETAREGVVDALIHEGATIGKLNS
jgi:hypothetical protein